MRVRFVVLLGAVAALAACDSSTSTSPTDDLTDVVVDVVPDYALSEAASMDAAGIGGAQLPDNLRLTVEQKAAIAALHDAFTKAIAADVDALRGIEQEARAAIRAHKSRDEIRAILAKADPIRARLDAAFKKLQADIWAVYTPEQKAWIESHRPRACGPVAVRLTDDQVKQIRVLQERFVASVKADLDLVKSVAEEARAARAAGKSREEVAAILAKANDAQRRIADAERKLQDAILALLTPAQKQAWLCRRG
jgi:Spy/CpxP family protein refolding chaperone